MTEKHYDDPLAVSKINIAGYAQNKPSLICTDLERIAGVPPIVSAKILMARGVFKWLAVRRELIKLKDMWREELTQIYRRIERGEVKRNSPEHRELVGYMKALEKCRKQVRQLCHSHRWQCPDHDLEATDLLDEII